MSQPTPSKTDPDGADGVGDGALDPDADVDVDADPEVEDPPAESDLRTMWLDSDDAGDLISSLSSETARSIVVRLHEQPSTASELADAVGTSVQNVRHHLDSLQESGLVEVAEVRYSSKGREMDVYAPVDEPMVVFVGREERSGFVDSLKRFLGAIGVLAAASLLIQWFVVMRLAPGSGGGITRTPEGGVAADLTALGIPPGLLFFAGGALVLSLVSAWRFYRRSADDGPVPGSG
jgi:DNA-binding transcriptional ArsR family regulator